MIEKIMKKIVRFLDPKWEKYRPRKPEYAPETEEELIGVLKRTPKSVLSRQERGVIAAAMSFKVREVRELMEPKEDVPLIYENDVLGPLMLDKLYRSGFSHFPVLNKQGQIIGILHTAALNSLEIKKTNTAKKMLDQKVYYLREDYTLEQALAAFLRTNCYFFIVVDKQGEMVGILNYDALVGYLLGDEVTDKFDRDNDKYAVAGRKL